MDSLLSESAYKDLHNYNRWPCLYLPHSIPPPKLWSVPYVSRQDINDEYYFSNWVSRMIREKSSKRRLFRHSLITVRSGPIPTCVSVPSPRQSEEVIRPHATPHPTTEDDGDTSIEMTATYDTKNTTEIIITGNATNTSPSVPTLRPNKKPTKCYVRWHTYEESNNIDLYFNSVLRKNQKQRPFVDRILLYLL